MYMVVNGAMLIFTFIFIYCNALHIVLRSTSHILLRVHITPTSSSSGSGVLVPLNIPRLVRLNDSSSPAQAQDLGFVTRTGNVLLVLWYWYALTLTGTGTST